MVATITISALLIAILLAFVFSDNTFDLNQINSIASEVELSADTPQGVLKEQLRKGNINREVYEMYVSEKLGVEIA
jgi:uncharacterized membrane protein